MAKTLMEKESELNYQRVVLVEVEEIEDEMVETIDMAETIDMIEVAEAAMVTATEVVEET